MSQRPKRETANTKPAQIIIDNIQKRRTSAQVQEDARNAAAAKAAKQAADAELKAEKIARIAAAEDKLRREDEDAKKNAERPDLVVGKKRGSKKSVSVLDRENSPRTTHLTTKTSAEPLCSRTYR